MTHRIALLLVLLVAGSAVLAQDRVTPIIEPEAAIRAAHKKIDDEYAHALMSPFTAVAVQYFAPRQTARLGADDAGAAFDPAKPMAAMVDITLEEGAYWIAPVPGSQPPVVLVKEPGGKVANAPGSKVTAKVKISDKEAVRLGRFLVESLAGAQPTNIRVFDPESAAKKAYAGLKWFAPNLGLQVKATFAANPKPEKVIIGTSRGLQKEFYRAGTLRFIVGDKAHTLTALAFTPAPKAGDPLFVPFRDATTGVETYQVGRYLEMVAKPAGETYVIDFNAATNPLCNYSPHYNCPIPPKENVLSVPIRAGEMTYPIHY